MDETQLLEEQAAQDENNIIELPVAQEEVSASEEEEKVPLHQLFDDVEALKERLTTLEANLTNHSHTIDLNQVADLVYQKINAFLRAVRKK